MGLVSDKQEKRFEDFGFTIGGPVSHDPRFKIINSKDELYSICGDKVIEICNQPKEVLNFGLSGGSLGFLYEFLAKNYPTSFEDVVFWQVDERFVDSEDDDSNKKLIEGSFLNRISRYKDFKYFDTELEEVEEIVDDYEKELSEIGQMDLLILGVGQDGHIASVFPGSEAINLSKKACHTQTEDFEIKDRFTLSLSNIMSAKKILVVLQGRNKKEIFEEIQKSEKTVEQLPAKKLLEHENVEFYLGYFE